MGLEGVPGVAQAAHSVGPPRRSNDRTAAWRRREPAAVRLPRARHARDDLALPRRGHRGPHSAGGVPGLAAVARRSSSLAHRVQEPRPRAGALDARLPRPRPSRARDHRAAGVRPRRPRSDGVADEVPEPHLRGAAPRDVHRVARPDDRLDGSPDDRRRSRRPRPSVVGRHRLPAGVDGRRSALREARRPLRAQASAPGRPRYLPRRVGAVRSGAEHAAADRVPRRAGPRRWRTARAGDGRRRRPRLAARARPLPGPLRRRLRRLGRSQGRCSAASSSTTSPGGGSSTSTCRSASSLWR